MVAGVQAMAIQEKIEAAGRQTGNMILDSKAGKRENTS